MSDIKADLQLIQRATPGPWNKIVRKDERLYVGTESKPIADICNLYGDESEANLQFVAQAREGWPHAIERAIKAEALNRELVEALDEIKKRGDWLKRDCTEPDKVMIYAISINLMGNGVLTKAKEALGDE